jgi:hypothetical protein
MRMLLGRVLDAVAPVVCADCDEGSGWRRDPRTGSFERCSTCDGTGRPLANTQRRA